MSFRDSILNISPIIQLLNYPSNAIMVWNGRKSIDYKICVPLCFMVLAGIIPGTFFFANTDTRLLEGIFGIVVVVIALEMLLRKKKERQGAQKVDWKLTILGILSGFVCGFCGTGVLVGTYLTKVTDNTRAFKANACVVYFLSDTIRIAMFIWLSVLSADIFWQTLALFPIAMLGLWLGIKSSNILNEVLPRRLCW